MVAGPTGQKEVLLPTKMERRIAAGHANRKKRFGL